MMRNLVLAILVLGLGLVGLQAQASANLLTEPGFDGLAAGTALSWGGTPWGGGGGGGDLSGGGAIVTDQKFNSASRSLAMYIYGANWAWALAQQAVGVGDITPGQTYNASATFLRDADISAGGANALFKVEWLNSLGGALSTSVGTANFNNSYAVNTWSLVSDQFIAPANAASAKFDIVYSKAASVANPGNVWADNASFDVIPEPTSMILLGSGLLGLLGISRKKRS